MAAIAALFFDSVHGLAAKSYTPEQCLAWAPQSLGVAPDLEQWRSRLASLETLVADFGGVIGGFISYTSNGYIELLYTSPAYSRQGVASKLYTTVRQRLSSQGITNFSTAASIVARPFFERMGFRVVEAQVVERNGVQLRRFAMTTANIDC